MTWAEISARLNADVADHVGESCVLISGETGAETDCMAVVVRVPGEIAPGGAWEYRPTASIPAAQLSALPSQGDRLRETATSREWLIDAAEEYEGMYQLTLRADP